MNEIQPKKFKFELNIRGVIDEVLANAPDGWLKTNIKYARSTVYGGLVRSLTLPFKYIGYGAGVLRKEYYTFGPFSNVKLIMSIQNTTNWLYKVLFRGRLDFSKWVDESDTGVTLNATEDDFSVQLAAFESQDYTIPLDGDNIIELTLPALKLTETADFILRGNTDTRSDAFFINQLVQNNQVATQSSVREQPDFFAESNPDWATEGRWFYRATVTNKLRVFGNMKGLVFAIGGSRFQINFYKSDGSLAKTIYDVTAPPATPTAFDFKFDFLIDVSEGERVFLYFKNVTNDNTNVGFSIEKGNFSLEYNTRSPDSKCKSIRAFDLYKTLLQLMNTTSPNEPNLPVPCQSYLLTTVFKGLVYSCSDSIRSTYINDDGVAQNSAVGAIYQPGDTLQQGATYTVLGGAITYNDILYNINDSFKYVLGVDTFSTINGGFVKQTSSTASIVINFKDFFQDIYALNGGAAAFGLETITDDEDNQSKIAYLEDLNYVFRNNTGSLKLNNTDAPKLESATDLMANSIKAGYKDQQYDTINGNGEVNSEQKYVTDLVTPARELNLQAVSRADPIGAEITRVTPVDTSSSRSDNDRFMFIIKDVAEGDGSFKPVQMDALTSYSGVDESYYNWFISPKRNLLRGGAYLHSIFDKMDGYYIRRTKALKNGSMITTDSTGLRVSEAEPINISTLPNRLFLPYYVTIKPGFRTSVLDVIDATPYADIGFKMNGYDVKGFIKEVSSDEGTNSAQEYKLILCPDVDTKKFIH